MRILHTSDWHLGRSFHREDLLGAQAGFVDHLVALARAERVDLVCIAGDLYDRAIPPVDAVTLCNEALARLAAARVRTVVISGNHDSARRLGFGRDLIDAAGVHLRTDPARCHEPVLIEPGDAGGPVAVYALPYLEPDLVRAAFEVEERSHAAVLGAAMDRVRADLATRPGTRSVVLAHAFVQGGTGCDSERDLTVGGAAAVSGAVFAGVDYVALGHLHRQQVLEERMRYAGSPLPYSFSEADHVKGCWLVDLDRAGRTTAEHVPAPVPRPVARIRGRFDDLLAAQRWAGHEQHWLHVTLTDTTRPIEPMERLRRRFPHLLLLDFQPSGVTLGAGGPPRVAGRSDLEIAEEFVAEVRRRPTDDVERALFDDAFAAVRSREATA